jgi:ABC-type transport system involved in multi-copper enzyme maturation permease subunit
MWSNPLLQKEFRQRMRTSRAPYVISGYLLSMTALTFLLIYENVQAQLVLFQPAKSEQVFVTLSLLQLTVVAFLTPAFAANSISGERERRTLVVLLTTPLSPIGILAGKVLSSCALLALLLVVTLPLYSLVFLLGGAVPQEVLSVFAFQLFIIVLIATYSVMWSTLALRSGWSTVLSYATVAWMTIVTGVVGFALKVFYANNPISFYAAKWANLLLCLNPLWIEAALENALPGVGGNHPSLAHALFIFVAFYGSLCVVLSLLCIWRLRPQFFRWIPGMAKAEEQNYQ